MDSIAVVVFPHYQCLPTDLLIFSKLKKKGPCWFMLVRLQRTAVYEMNRRDL